MLHVPGKLVKRKRLVKTEQFVVEVEIEMLIPDDDSSEPCLEPCAVKFLRDVKDRAEQGDVAWLAKHGKVYKAIGDAA